MVPAHSHKVSRVSWYSGYCLSLLQFRLRGFHPLWLVFPEPFFYRHRIINAVRTPECSHSGLGSAGFARRYSRYRSFFLFLRLLRCFSSPGSLRITMDSWYGDGSLFRRVSPFRYPRIIAYLQLPVAFRSLSRLSSALSAKASTLRSSSLNLSTNSASVDNCSSVPWGACTPKELWVIVVTFAKQMSWNRP